MKHYLWAEVTSYSAPVEAMLDLLWAIIAVAESKGETIMPALESGERRERGWNDAYKSYIAKEAAGGERQGVVVRSDPDGAFGVHEFLSKRRLSQFTLSLLPPELHNAKNLASHGKPEMMEILAQQRHPRSIDAVFLVPAIECDALAGLVETLKALVSSWSRSYDVTFGMLRRLSGRDVPYVAQRETQEEAAAGLDWEVARQTLDRSIRGPAHLWWLSPSHVGGIDSEAALGAGSGFSLNKVSERLWLSEAPALWQEYSDQALDDIPKPLASLLPRSDLRAGLRLTSDYLAQFRPGGANSVPTRTPFR
jgi:hypothetical protein